MASSSGILLLRLICRKGFAAAGSSNNISWNRTAAAGCSNWFYYNGRRQMSTLQNPSSSSSSPWLMLPPASDGSYNLYSLADNKVITLSGHEQELGDDVSKLKCRGSSRGWLALLSPQNLDLFLFNPISRRHIKLPPIKNLPVFPDDKTTSRDLQKVFLSCSPDDENENCRAVIIHNNGLLASCCPGRSNEWTQFGGEYLRDEASGKNFSRGYDDCAYSSAQRVLFGLTWDGDLETWDLGDPSSPRLINKVGWKKKKKSCLAASLRAKHFVAEVEHLVVVEDHLLWVTQYVMNAVAPDGSFCYHIDERSQNCPHMTLDFTVHKYDPEQGDFKHVDRWSLGGLAIFVGIQNQSVAFHAASDQQYPELKPNSIYFTNPYGIGSLEGDCDDDDDDLLFGGHDIGIFNYQDKTVSPCYYPCDVQSLKKIVPPPMWFFPSRFI